MAIHIVDLLEAIEIEKQDSAAVFVDPRADELLLETVFEQLPVGKAGQWIEVGLAIQGFLALDAGERSEFDALAQRTGRPADWRATLPVAGTSIVNHSLYGRWKVLAHLDGSPIPCAPARAFWIGP